MEKAITNPVGTRKAQASTIAPKVHHKPHNLQQSRRFVRKLNRLWDGWPLKEPTCYARSAFRGGDSRSNWAKKRGANPHFSGSTAAKVGRKRESTKKKQGNYHPKTKNASKPAIKVKKRAKLFHKFITKYWKYSNYCPFHWLFKRFFLLLRRLRCFLHWADYVEICFLQKAIFDTNCFI